MSWAEYKHAIVCVHISGTCLTFSTVCVLRRRKNETKSFLTIPSMDFSIGFPLRPGRVVVFFLSLPMSGKCSILQTGKFFCSGEWKKRFREWETCSSHKNVFVHSQDWKIPPTSYKSSNFFNSVQQSPSSPLALRH